MNLFAFGLWNVSNELQGALEANWGLRYPAGSYILKWWLNICLFSFNLRPYTENQNVFLIQFNFQSPPPHLTICWIFSSKCVLNTAFKVTLWIVCTVSSDQSDVILCGQISIHIHYIVIFSLPVLFLSWIQVWPIEPNLQVAFLSHKYRTHCFMYGPECNSDLYVNIRCFQNQNYRLSQASSYETTTKNKVSISHTNVYSSVSWLGRVSFLHL